ncbi:hypothetical protein GCM10018793_61870 [Streptomyces sulfonofaciens]|uniref:Single-stranded DNA-binding protein n=1 Tax=Streptomyces sulfonofaciens TaxID=68272 RepID=A0A919L6X1_9ACTN|nr:single-stranded DNA-binding protein [Streptomyces sulfonofaciens]GHH87145.1 hypothetical protein GCM10018793_61870 [Streptomyces sulfonofaciens]
MNETMVTVVGNVATTPVFRELPSGPVARFRLAATARHRDRTTGQWSDGHTNFFTVWARRALGGNAAASLSVGDPVIVQGRLRVRNEERGGGQQWMSADVDALVIGHDLSRGTSAFRRTSRTDGTTGGQQPAAKGEGPPPSPPFTASAEAGPPAPPPPPQAARAGSAGEPGAGEPPSAARHPEPAWEQDPVPAEAPARGDVRAGWPSEPAAAELSAAPVAVV